MPLTSNNQAPGGLENRALPSAARLLPWLLGGLMLGVYGLTLNHWASPESILSVVRLEGLTWTPQLTGPVTFLITAPFGWLPAGWIPVAVNLFTAGCAALSLAWLARSVALLPHNLSLDPPTRRRSFQPPTLMTSWSAWLPPLFAVLVCGLQSSFWQNAIADTGQMFNLLMFAYVIRSLLEYNASGKDSWLLRGALVYGLAVTNDWVMAAFFPFFVAALIWVKGFLTLDRVQLEQWLTRWRSLDLRLWWQLPALWLAGLSLFLLLPALAWLTPDAPQDFWPSLYGTLHSYKISLTHIPRQLLITSCLISVMPVFLMGLRYYHFLTHTNRVNLFIGKSFFQLIFGFFLLLCLWMVFDPPLSPCRQAPGLDSLPLYFLQALSIGYFTGHFLLVTEAQPEAAPGERRRAEPAERRRRQRMLLLNRLFKWSCLAGTLALVAGIPAALICRNLPVVVLNRSDPCGDYFAQMVQALPADGAVVLGNDTSQLLYLQSALIRTGRPADYLVLDPEALTQRPDYLDFLKRQNPRFNLEVSPFAQPGSNTNRTTLVTLLQNLSGTHPIYCLHPAPLLNLMSEFFYYQPHGLLYELKPYVVDTAFAGPTPPQLLQDNDTFWRAFEQRQLADLVRRANPTNPPPPAGLVKRFLNTLRFWPQHERAAQLAAIYYAAALNDWGVELQRTGKFPAAGHCFAESLQLYPPFPPAQINQKFNADYQANRQETVARPLETAKSMNEYRDWQHVVRNGAVDEPNFCFMLGAILADNNLFRPAITQFERVKELSPARLDTYISLARLFIKCLDYTNGLATVNEVLAVSPTNQVALLLKAGVYMHQEAYDQAVPLLNQVLALDPTNNLVLLNRGTAYSKLGQGEAARRDFNTLVQTVTNAFPAYYELAKLADQEKNPAAAIRNYELFLKYAPTNIFEIPEVRERLKALKPAAP